MSYDINEVKSQLWSHLQDIKGRLDELSEQGIIPHANEWEDIWGIGKRHRWWLVDQLYAVRDEIEYWKNIRV